jgi:hypothetical protein
MHIKSLFITTLAIASSLLVGCSTTQEVTLAKLAPSKKIVSVAQAADADNSTQMNGSLEAALQKEGLSLKAPLALGTRKSADVDALVSYVDYWRWDLAMYMKNLTVNLYDAETGDLLVSGRWNDSTLHGFRDAKVIMQGLVSEMLAKLKAATK